MIELTIKQAAMMIAANKDILVLMHRSPDGDTVGCAYALCYALRKLNIKVSIPAVVVGALCHDLGILGRSEKFSSAKECSREHPKDSVEVARGIVGEMPEKTEDIIERHMWPAGESEAPNSIEGVVVSVADKYSAVKDLVKGSEVNNTGVKNYLRSEKQKIVEKIKE